MNKKPSSGGDASCTQSLSAYCLLFNMCSFDLHGYTRYTTAFKYDHLFYKLVEQKRPQSNLISLGYNFYEEMHCDGKWIHNVNKCWFNLSPIKWGGWVSTRRSKKNVFIRRQYINMGVGQVNKWTLLWNIKMLQTTYRTAPCHPTVKVVTL